MERYVGAIDQGTTSTRFMIFDRTGSVLVKTQREHRQILSNPGWVEHDPHEILKNTWAVIEEALSSTGLTRHDLAAIGITNQRETTVLWNRRTGRAVYNALVWQDTRTSKLVEELAEKGGLDRWRSITGLPLSTYFAAPKASWLIENVEGLAESAAAGDILFGTIDSWLIWNLTGGAEKGIHVTDVTNASRTLMFDLKTLAWEESIVATLGLKNLLLPTVFPSIGRVGMLAGPLEGVPVSAILGDQQAALFGQTAFKLGELKNTYGTGCFLLLNTGENQIPSEHGLITTVAYQAAGQSPVYALEGSVAVAGSVIQWLRDELGIIESASDVEYLAQTVEDNGDVYFVPAFSGLFSPRWRPDARGLLIGLTRFSNRGHLARAAIEATAFQAKELVEVMELESGLSISELRVDGGMVKNQLLMQFQADLLDVPVVRPVITETTAVGAAYAAGLAEGYWSDFTELRENWQEGGCWKPQMEAKVRSHLLRRWSQAVERSLDWV